jgi:hypothetical protein
MMNRQQVLFLLIILMVISVPCAARSPPGWLAPGMKITYTAALSNYYLKKYYLKKRGADRIERKDAEGGIYSEIN